MNNGDNVWELGLSMGEMWEFLGTGILGGENVGDWGFGWGKLRTRLLGGEKWWKCGDTEHALKRKVENITSVWGEQGKCWELGVWMWENGENIC